MRYRSSGEQTMRVGHVTVNEGGQAIVGNVFHGGGGLLKKGTNLMKREYAFQKAARCSATSKRTKERCEAPAVRGWTVCRFHGARGGAPKGKPTVHTNTGSILKKREQSAAWFQIFSGDHGR
jgi:hypothetical protein